MTATANVNTLFIGLLPQYKTIPVAAQAVATRGDLIMSIVLDRSGSMCGGSNSCDSGVTGDSGGVALQSAVPTFIGDFNDATDRVGMVSFASNDVINVPIGYNFKTTITSAVNGLKVQRRYLWNGRRNRLPAQLDHGAAAVTCSVPG